MTWLVISLLLVICAACVVALRDVHLHAERHKQQEKDRAAYGASKFDPRQKRQRRTDPRPPPSLEQIVRPSLEPQRLFPLADLEQAGGAYAALLKGAGAAQAQAQARPETLRTARQAQMQADMAAARLANIQNSRRAATGPQQQAKPYVYQEYPKWKYHRQKSAVIVRDESEERALGLDWLDFPVA